MGCVDSILTGIAIFWVNLQVFVEPETVSSTGTADMRARKCAGTRISASSIECIWYRPEVNRIVRVKSYVTKNMYAISHMPQKKNTQHFNLTKGVS